MTPIYRFFIARPTVNLLDPGMAINGYRLNTANGKLVAASALTSDYMPVVAGTEYNTKHTDGVAMQMSYIVFYNKDYEFVSGASNVNAATAPAGAVFARVTFPAGLDLSEWQFAESSLPFSEFVSSRVFPVYKDDIAIDYSLQQGEEFYRGALSGKFTFESADYDFINTAAFDKRFDFEIRISFDGGKEWRHYWGGKFYKTDCQFNDDEKTVKVTPVLNDVYNDVLAGISKEYDLIKLAPEIVPIKYDKRPMLQFYIPGTSTVACYLSGMWWEQECSPTEDYNQLYSDCRFFLSVNMTIAELVQTGTPVIPRSMFVANLFGHYENGYTLTSQDYELVVAQSGVLGFSFTIRDTTNHTPLWTATRMGNADPPLSIQLSPVEGSGATGTVDVRISVMDVFSRLVTDKETEETSEFSANDIILDKRNYRYVAQADCTDAIIFNSYFAENPTEWGLYEPGYYYLRPNAQSFPISRKLWGAFSIWLNSAAIPDAIDEENRQAETLRDAYPIASVISVLLGQFAPGITHQGTTDYSRFLYGESDPLTFVSHHLFITPKSNILASGYDQPAQTAKITLRAVLDMLRDCFRCYWFIDEQKRFRIEHIEYFRLGGSYSLLPSVGIDLTQEIVTRNGKPWSFARSQYQFEKPAMAERYQFGWMDEVTEQFEGQPIDIISGYVEPGNIESITVNQFTSDVDYMLLNPGACSKDGFALLSAVYLNGRDIETYNLMSFASITRQLGTDGKWMTNSNEHIIIPVVAGQRFKVKANATYGSQLAWFTSDAAPVAGENAPLVAGTSRFTIPSNTTDYITAPFGANYLYVFRGQPSSPGNFLPASLVRVSEAGYYLPYERFGNSNLQNGQLCWPYLQIYYVWDMPARNYKIGTQQYTASGVKKLKTQSLKFPVLREPNFYELVKTELGNGTIQKLSVNLSSRNANATLKYEYDTE